MTNKINVRPMTLKVARPPAFIQNITGWRLVGSADCRGRERNRAKRHEPLPWTDQEDHGSMKPRKTLSMSNVFWCFRESRLSRSFGQLVAPA